MPSRGLWVVLAASLLAGPAFADEEIKVQRYLADLYLGDSLELVKKLYPKTGEWPSHPERKGKVERFKIERKAAGKFPPNAVVMWLSLRNDRIVEIQLVYSLAYTREKSVEKLAADYALVYGEPKRKERRFWWDDGKTVMRIQPYPFPKLKPDGTQTEELRTSLQLMNADLLSRKN